MPVECDNPIPLDRDEEHHSYDVEYVQSQSIAVDVRIILGTIKVLLTGAGAEGHPTDDPLASTDDEDDGDEP